MAMTPFEKMAIFSVIETMEKQLQGLKALIATSNNDIANVSPHKVTQPVDAPNSSHYTNEQDEAHLEMMMEKARLETEKLAHDGEKIHQKLFEETTEELRG